MTSHLPQIFYFILQSFNLRKKKKAPAWFSRVLTISFSFYQELPLHHLLWLSTLTSIFKLSSFPERNDSRRKLVQFACSSSWLWKQNVVQNGGTHSCRETDTPASTGTALLVLLQRTCKGRKAAQRTTKSLNFSVFWHREGDGAGLMWYPLFRGSKKAKQQGSITLHGKF